MDKKLYKLKDQKMIAGVCGGIAEYFAVDPTIVRLLFVLLLLAAKVGAVIAYIVIALILPEKPADTTSGENATAEGTPAKKAEHNSKTILGLALVALGGFMLFERYFHWIDLSVLAAIGVIALGAYIVLKGEK